MNAAGRTVRAPGRVKRDENDNTNIHRRACRCAACGNELFSSDAKLESGPGWPSFTEPADRASVSLHYDYGHGMDRIEVTCAVCGGYLGRVFGDGPGETGSV